MTLKDVLIDLGIEQYQSRIFNSNSRGELMHLQDYLFLQQIMKAHPELRERFPEWFKETVELAEAEWNRPESVFQHILEIFRDSLKGH